MHSTLDCVLQTSFLQVLLIYTLLINELGISGMHAALSCDDNRYQEGSLLYEWSLSWSVSISWSRGGSNVPGRKILSYHLELLLTKVSLLFFKQTSALWTVSPMMWTRPSTSVMMRGTCWTAHALARAGGDGNVILLVSHQLFLLAKQRLWLCRNWLWYGETGVWIWTQSLPAFSPELHNCKSRSNTGFAGG